MFPPHDDELDKRNQESRPPKSSIPGNVWSGIKSYLGVGDQADVSQSDLFRKPMAYTRFTRTPVYQDPDLPKNVGGRYYPADPLSPTASIGVPPDELQKYSDKVLPHESAHAIYDQGKLTPAQVGSVPQRASGYISRFPDLYARDRQTQATEGLAFSVGEQDATPFIERVAGQMQDRKAAQRLLRLHQNAVQTRIKYRRRSE